MHLKQAKTTHKAKQNKIAFKCHNKFENDGIMLHDCGILLSNDFHVGFISKVRYMLWGGFGSF